MFFTNQALTSHVNTNHRNHKDIRPFKCNVCLESFRTKGNLRNHGVIHTGEKLFKCPNCPKMYAWQKSLDYHMKTQHSETQETFACDICDRVCLTKGNLKKHLETHLEDRKVYKCRTCEKSFLHKTSLLHHGKRHRGDLAFKCNKCPASFPINSQLQYHMQRHVGTKKFSCNSCQKTFYDSSSLKDHNDSKHSTSPKYKCDLCNKQYFSRGSWKYHKSTHHDKKETRKKTFTEKGTLNRHLLTHAQEKRFKCILCQKPFATQSKLKQHVSTHVVQENENVLDIQRAALSTIIE